MDASRLRVNFTTDSQTVIPCCSLALAVRIAVGLMVLELATWVTHHGIHISQFMNILLNIPLAKGAVKRVKAGGSKGSKSKGIKKRASKGRSTKSASSTQAQSDQGGATKSPQRSSVKRGGSKKGGSKGAKRGGARKASKGKKGGKGRSKK